MVCLTLRRHINYDISSTSISGIASIVIGCALIIFRKWFARESVEAKNWMFGLHFGERTIGIGYWFISLMGLAFIVSGILLLFGAALYSRRQL